MRLLRSRSRSQGRFKILVNVCPDDIFSVSDHVRSIFLMCMYSTFFFPTKLGMGVYYHESMCHAEKLVHYLQCQGHSKGLYNQNVTVFTVTSKLLILM